VPARHRKIARLVWALARNAVQYTAPFVRFIPTDRCNLDCRYCFQKSADPREMTLAEFETYLEKAHVLGIGMASFLGGEPLTWGPLVDGVALCTERGVFSDITTNGTLLNSEKLDRLGRAGLDLLNVSADVIDVSEVTAKNAVFRQTLIEGLEAMQREHGTRVRINSVFYRDNSDSIKGLVELAHRHGFPISVGFVVPHFNQGDGDDISFSLDDRGLLEDMVGYLIDRKDRGYRIIDTRHYFRNVFRFLDRERFWECNYGRRIGWLNVTPSGRIRSCTKKMDEMDVRFLDLTPAKIKALRREFRAATDRCNVDCYSNCAYNGYYFFRNMPSAVLRYAAGHHRRVSAAATSRGV
jgi:MoaA/NifB/PqqE/SkfB family radical SAM enzyme